MDGCKLFVIVVINCFWDVILQLGLAIGFGYIW